MHMAGEGVIGIGHVRSRGRGSSISRRTRIRPGALAHHVAVTGQEDRLARRSWVTGSRGGLRTTGPRNMHHSSSRVEGVKGRKGSSEHQQAGRVDERAADGGTLLPPDSSRCGHEARPGGPPGRKRLTGLRFVAMARLLEVER